MGTCFGQARAFLYGRAKPAPPRGGPSRGEMALRGKAGNDVNGGFLGGVRSPRPDGITHGKRFPQRATMSEKPVA